MGRVATTVGRSEVLPLAALLLLGCVAFLHLMELPAFEDEGSQLRLIWRVVEAGEWLQPLGEGKPLEAWPMVPLVMLTAQPLLAIRALHVAIGMIGALLMYRLAAQITSRGIAFASAALFAVCPFVVYLERVAHSDIMMCAAGIWVMLSVIRLVGSPDWPSAAALAVALVLAALSKLPVGFVFLTSMPFALLCMPTEQRRMLLRPPALTRVLAAHAPAALLALLVLAVAIVRLQRGQPPGFGLEDFMGIAVGSYRDIAAVIGLPRPNLIGELTAQLSWPVVGLGLVGLAASTLSNDWRQRWLIVSGATPLLGIGFLAEFWFSRYLLFTLPPLIIAATCGWRSLALRFGRFSRITEIAVLAVCLGLMGLQSGRIVFAVAAARWSPLDRFQYFEGWGSGYGYPEAAQFLLSTQGVPPMIYSLDGHSAYQLRSYLPPAWSRRVQPIFYAADGQALRAPAARLANLGSHAPAWIIIAQPLLQRYMSSSFGSEGAAQIALRPIASFPKPGSRSRLDIYEATLR